MFDSFGDQGRRQYSDHQILDRWKRCISRLTIVLIFMWFGSARVEHHGISTKKSIPRGWRHKVLHWWLSSTECYVGGYRQCRHTGQWYGKPNCHKWIWSDYNQGDGWRLLYIRMCCPTKIIRECCTNTTNQLLCGRRYAVVFVYYLKYVNISIRVDPLARLLT